MKFKFHSRILEQLGPDLITNDEVAIAELIKNSYDARAKNVRIHFIQDLSIIEHNSLLTPLTNEVRQEIEKTAGNSPIIVIEDDGEGMNDVELEKGFFVVGSDIKKVSKKEIAEKETHEGRVPQGEKGLGRLAAQRLSKTMYVETHKPSIDNLYLVKIEWLKFLSSDKFESTDETYQTHTSSGYTRLWFTDLSVDLGKFIRNRSQEQLSLYSSGINNKSFTIQEELQAALSFLYSPFEEVSEGEKLNIEVWYNNHLVKSDFQSNVVGIAEAVHSFKVEPNIVFDELENNSLCATLAMEIRPWYLERVHLRLLGRDLYSLWRRTPEYYSELLSKHKHRYDALKLRLTIKNDFTLGSKKVNDIAPIEVKVYSFKRDRQLLSIAIDSAKRTGYIKDSVIKTDSIKPFLDNHNGIKLYRGNFRIANLGDKNSDWLKLQQARTKGQQFFRFELGNVIGYVKINDPYQEYIKEISSRQEIKAGEHQSALAELLDKVFNDHFYKLSSSAYYITKDILKEEGILPQDTTEQVEEKLSRSESTLQETQKNLDAFKRAFNSIKENSSLDSPSKISAMREIINNLEATTEGLSENISKTALSLQDSKNVLAWVNQERKNIEIESYNNFKLMANGLVTEVLTHELHSLLVGTNIDTTLDLHVDNLKKHLIELQQVKLFADHVRPLDKRIHYLHDKMNELNRFYSLLEQTFLFKGTKDDFVSENLYKFLSDMEAKMSQRLKNSKIDFVFNTIDMEWEVPKGALIHLFYNLIDNAIYWIGERQKRARYDNTFTREGEDYIVVEKVSKKEINIYDSGIGVVSAMQHTLFHPLSSGKEKGRGMGLYIVKNFLESFGASIHLLPDLNEFGNRYIFQVQINYEFKNGA